MSTGEERVKIMFRLERDDSDYPPADFEDLWAKETADGFYELDNIPFFAKPVRVGDVVSAVHGPGGELRFSGVVRPSAHATLRVIVFRDSVDQRPLPIRVDALRTALKEMGCSTELSHVPGLVAVDVPPEASLNAVTSRLAEGESAGSWEYEEAAFPRNGSV
jgi:hypothetical protein